MSRLVERVLVLRAVDPDLTALLTRAGRIALMLFGIVTVHRREDGVVGGSRSGS